ncbi:MAG: MazG nucleotide pyrophosphohydrolase domain-containing protein [Lawsonella sp.]
MTAHADNQPASQLQVVWQMDKECPDLLPAKLAADIAHAAVTAELVEFFPGLPVWSEKTASGLSGLVTTLSADELAATYPESTCDWDELVQPVEYPSGTSMVKAARVMSRVRAHGLWEQKQTHQSLVPYLLEETYELADAIAQLPENPEEAAEEVTEETTADLVAELGDVFLEVLFHAAVGETASGPAHFDYDDVAEAFLTKLRKRMPYAFDGGQFPASEEEQDALWQQSKARDKKSPLEGIVRAQPALALVTQIVERAKRAGVPESDIPLDFQRIAAINMEGDGTAEELLRDRALRFLKRIREEYS